MMLGLFFSSKISAFWNTLIYSVSQKKLTLCICLISQEPRNGFLNCFFLLKPETHMQILSTKPFLYDIRELRYLQNKKGFWNTQVHIHVDLKLSSQHRNGPKMPQLTADWPGYTLRGPKGPKVAQTGLSGVGWASQAPVRASQGQSDTAKTTSGHS